MFDARRLEALHHVAVHGSVAAAASALHLTPSAVSQQLAALEREAGCDLLVRRGRGVELTAAGHALAGHAQRVVDQLAAARAELDRLQGAARGVVRITAFPTAIRGVLVPALAGLGVLHPDVELHLTEAEPDVAVDRLVAGDADLAVIHSYDLVPRRLPVRAVTVHLLDDPLFLVVPAGHPVAAGGRPVDVTSLERERWITPGPGTTCLEEVRRVTAAAGFVPAVVAACAEYETTLDLVRAGAGIALVPGLGVRGRDLAGLAVLDTSPVHHRTVQLAHPPNPSAAAGVVADALVEVARSISAPGPVRAPAAGAGPASAAASGSGRSGRTRPRTPR